MKVISIFIAAAVVLIAVSCLSPKKGYRSVTAEEFSDIISNDPEVQILDVRTPAEYAEGHIYNAINVDVKSAQFEKRVEVAISKDRLVAVYCRSGRRSKTAADFLVSKGYDVVDLNKGFIEWQSLNMPVSIE